jgi:hypothetical protein
LQTPSFLSKQTRSKNTKKIIPFIFYKKCQRVFYKRIYKNKILTKKYTLSLLNFFERKILKKDQLFSSLKRTNRKRRNYIFNNNKFVNRKTTLVANLIPRTKVIRQSYLSKHRIGINNTLLSSDTKQSYYKLHTNSYIILSQVVSSFFLKSHLTASSTKNSTKLKLLISSFRTKYLNPSHLVTNLLPHTSFNKVLSKKVLSSFTNKNFDEDIVS